MMTENSQLQKELTTISVFPARDRCMVAPVVTITERGHTIHCPNCRSKAKGKTAAYEKWDKMCQ